MPGGAKRAWPLLLWISLISALALLLYGCSASDGGASAQEPAGRRARADPPATAGATLAGERRARAIRRSARADAPVVMIEYGDYQ